MSCLPFACSRSPSAVVTPRRRIDSIACSSTFATVSIETLAAAASSRTPKPNPEVAATSPTKKYNNLYFFRASRFAFLRRTPGSPSFSSMNSTPAASSSWPRTASFAPHEFRRDHLFFPYLPLRFST